MKATGKHHAGTAGCKCRGAAGLYTRSQLNLAVAAVLYGAAAVRGEQSVAANATTADSIQEIVVTARKRTENLQDVPQSIDVFTSKDLNNLSISQFEDFATRTPSVSFISVGPGTQQFFMRGVSDGSNPNVTNTSSLAPRPRMARRHGEVGVGVPAGRWVL